MDAAPFVLERAVSTDGSRRWQLLKRADGFITYKEDTFFTEEPAEYDGKTIKYWTPTHVSGLFDAVAEARRDALGTLPWLRSVLTAT